MVVQDISHKSKEPNLVLGSRFIWVKIKRAHKIYTSSNENGLNSTPKTGIKFLKVRMFYADSP